MRSVINFVTNEENVTNYNIDKNNIFLVGHSMGVFLTLINCIDERIKSSVTISPYDFGLKVCVIKED